MKMLYYDRIDVSEGNWCKQNKRIKRMWCWYFFNNSFKFQPNFCDRCHDLLMMSVNLSDIAILNAKGFDYRCIISLISKREAINLLENADFTEKSGTLHIKKW